jgi:hypothetical protein
MIRSSQTALFDDIPEAPPAPRVNDRLEAAALAEVLKALKHHPLVAWAERLNSGVARMGGRFVRFGWPGCSDVIGQLKDGRLLAVECKAPKGKPTEEQRQFLDMVRRFGGVAFMARDCRDVLRELAADEVLT